MFSLIRGGICVFLTFIIKEKHIFYLGKIHEKIS